MMVISPSVCIGCLSTKLPLQLKCGAVMDAGRDVDHDEDERECLHLHHAGVLDWFACDPVVTIKQQALDDKVVSGVKVALVVTVAVVNLWS